MNLFMIHSIYILLIFNDKYNLFKVIHYNYIIKKWGRVHKDLGTK